MWDPLLQQHIFLHLKIKDTHLNQILKSNLTYNEVQFLIYWIHVNSEDLNLLKSSQAIMYYQDLKEVGDDYVCCIGETFFKISNLKNNTSEFLELFP